MGLFLQGLKTSSEVVGDLPPVPAEHQNQADRRNRVDRRRARNLISEGRARGLGLALDRRRSRSWFTALLSRFSALGRLQRRAPAAAGPDVTAGNSH